MDIEEEILAIRSKEQVNKFIRRVDTDKKRFRQLMQFFLQEDGQLAKKSAWIVGHCVEKHPELVQPWLKQMVKRIQQPGVHESVKRNIIRILQFVDIPHALKGSVANICFKLLSSIDAPIAARTFSITVLERIAQEEPALRKELKRIVEQMLPYATPAFRCRAKKLLSIQEMTDLSKNELDNWLNRR